jgi:hypothetical protein
MRLMFHDQNYMNSQFVPISAWQNKPGVASPDTVAFSTSSWRYDVPWIMSARDTMQHRVQLLTTPTSAQRVAITHSGLGMFSARPYFLTGIIDLDDEIETQMDTRNYRNDGAEPIIVADTTVQISAPEDDDEPTGDLRNLLFNVKQIGNGTQARWFSGPDTPPAPLMPAVLSGMTTGQAMVHRFAGDGLLWEPGEGIDAEIRSLHPSADNLILWLSFVGYITIS